MPFKKIEAEKLSNAVVRQIELLILRGILKPGERLPSERELAEKMVRVFQARYKPQHEYQLQSVTSEKFYGLGYEDSQVRIPDIEKTSRLLEWQPVTTLDQMLPLVIDDYFTRYAKDISGSDG